MKNWEKLIPPRDLENIYKICQVYKEGEQEIYLVGGCVRDLIIGNKPKDFDFATSASPNFAEEQFEKTNPVGKVFGTIQVVYENKTYEITTFRSDGHYSDGRHPDKITFSNLFEDAKRRDFKMNAIYWNPLTEELLDPQQGKKDIKQGLISFIGDAATRIKEDKLRILRAYRFHAQLGFGIDKENLEALKQYADQLTEVSWERIHTELKKILIAKEALSATSYLQEARIFQSLFNAPNKIDFYPFFTALLYVKDFNLDLEEVYGYFLYFLNPKLDIADYRLSKISMQAFRLFKRLTLDQITELQIYEELSSYRGTFLLHLLQHKDSKHYRKLQSMFQVEPHLFKMPDALVNSEDLHQEGLKGKDLGEALQKAYLFQIKNPNKNKKEILKEIL